MRTLNLKVLVGAFVVLGATVAFAFEENGLVDLVKQADLLRVAEQSTREAARKIEALNTAVFELRADEFEAVERLHGEAVAAHDVAESAVARARGQLELARDAVDQVLDQIEIEGAEDVEIGGEVRAARMLVLGWQRIVDTEVANLAQLREEIARIDALVAVAAGE